MVSFPGNLWQPPHPSADDRSHFTNVLMNAWCFMQCPWRSPRLSAAAVEGDGWNPLYSVRIFCFLISTALVFFFFCMYNTISGMTTSRAYCMYWGTYVCPTGWCCCLSWLSLFLKLSCPQFVMWPFNSSTLQFQLFSLHLRPPSYIFPLQMASQCHYCRSFCHSAWWLACRRGDWW